MVCLIKPYRFKFFRSRLPQINTKDCFMISKLLSGSNSDVTNCHHFPGAVVPSRNIKLML